MNKFIKRHKSASLALAALALMGVIGAGIYSYNRFGKTTESGTSNDSYLPKVDTRPAETESTGTATANDAAKTVDTKVETRGITISSPAPGTSIEPNVTTAKGTVTSAIGGDLYYMVKGSSSGVLIDVKVMTVAPGSSDVPYSFVINFDNMPKGSDSAVLEVYLRNGNTRQGYADVGVNI